VIVGGNVPHPHLLADLDSGCNNSTPHCYCCNNGWDAVRHVVVAAAVGSGIADADTAVVVVVVEVAVEGATEKRNQIGCYDLEHAVC